MKRSRVIAVVVIVLMAGAFGVHRYRNREPRYEGRTLSEWSESGVVVLEDVTHLSAERAALKNAMRQMGTNSVPFLLKKLEARDSRFTTRLKALVGRQSLFQFHFEDPAIQIKRGCAGLAFFPGDATGAVPALARLTQHSDDEVRYFALLALLEIKPKQGILVPILLQLNGSGGKAGRIATGHLMRWYPSEAEQAGVYIKYPWTNNYRTNNAGTNGVASP